MEGQFAISLWDAERPQPECPACGKDRWIGWGDRVRLEQVGTGEVLWPQGLEVTPLTCSGCGFVRLYNMGYRDVEAI